MKKNLLIIAAFILLALSANAQQRISLYEEFTGENSVPCAGTNPGLWALINANPTKIIDLSYMEPKPSSGWFYLQDQVVSDVRISYYSGFYGGAAGEFTPSGIQDGHIPDGDSAAPMHPYYFNQHDIDSMYAVSSPFNMTVTNSWDATHSNIISVVTITNTSGTPYTSSGPLYLRLALTEIVDFTTPPGSNGETHFNNVVREMFPDATGTTLPGSWATGASHTYTVIGACPSYVDKSKAPFMVGWVQDDGTKAVQQAAKGNPLPGIPNDASLISSTTSSGLICHDNTSYSVAHNVVLQNTGTSTLTSATIYYSIDGGIMAPYLWTGSLAATGTASVTMPAASITIAGAQYHIIYDSVDMPNGIADQNINNNVAKSDFFVESTIGIAMPYATSFEAADLAKFYMESLNSDGANWVIFNNGTPLGHTGTNAALWKCYAISSGDSAILTLPEITRSSPSYLNFWVAYAQYNNTTAPSNDKLEVVYSSDCGSTWTSLWAAAGSSLSTAPVTTTSFVPTSSQYAQHSVEISSVPSDAILAFRGISNYGNNIWVDDASISATTNVNQVTDQISLATKIYPNPAKDETNLSLDLVNSSNVTVQIIDVLGRVVSVVADDNMDAGHYLFNINTFALANGTYNIMIHIEGGTFTEHLSVAK